MDIVIPQPEFRQLTAKTLFVRIPITEKIHEAIHSFLENLWGNASFSVTNLTLSVMLCRAGKWIEIVAGPGLSGAVAHRC